MTKAIVKIKLTDGGKMPSQAHYDDACYDLYSAEDSVVYGHSVKAIDAGFKMELPRWYEAQIRPRSGMAKRGLTVVNSPGTIDAGYRGQVMVLLHNRTPLSHTVKKGDRIAQMAIKKVDRSLLVEVKELSESERGENGLGSTGD